MLNKIKCFFGIHKWRLCWCREEKDRFVGNIMCENCKEVRIWMFLKPKNMKDKND